MNLKEAKTRLAFLERQMERYKDDEEWQEIHMMRVGSEAIALRTMIEEAEDGETPDLQGR